MGRAHEVRAASMAKTAAKKTKIYSKFGKEIYIAAKNGVPDPAMNLTLKHIIDKAKAAQVPADVIKRNIEKAKGGTGESYIENMYEGFGPEGSTIVIQVLTDNVNRAFSEIRGCFNKAHCTLGVKGSVSFQYDNLGILSFDKDADQEEAVLDALIMADVDVKELECEDGAITVYTDFADLYKAKDAIDELYGETEYTILETRMMPQDYVTLTTDEGKTLFSRLLNLLDEVDDVQEIYHNVDNAEELA
ncbi:MAG: YebC/PmpR family DNA-binding transcriptional regulator [Erysipelotrichaceae bacterium]|nr:YebC/PmpR family DNA-binding transcriptional regulator [Erysipelotrichaceae bacterium]